MSHVSLSCWVVLLQPRGDEKHILIRKDRGSNICFLPPQPPLMGTYVQLHVVGDRGGSSLKGGERVNTDHVSHGQLNKLHCTPPSLWRRRVSISHLLVEKFFFFLIKNNHYQTQTFTENRQRKIIVFVAHCNKKNGFVLKITLFYSFKASLFKAEQRDLAPGILSLNFCYYYIDFECIFYNILQTLQSLRLHICTVQALLKSAQKKTILQNRALHST